MQCVTMNIKLSDSLLKEIGSREGETDGRRVDKVASDSQQLLSTTQLGLKIKKKLIQNNLTKLLKYMNI